MRGPHVRQGTQHVLPDVLAVAAERVPRNVELFRALPLRGLPAGCEPRRVARQDRKLEPRRVLADRLPHSTSTAVSRRRRDLRRSARASPSSSPDGPCSIKASSASSRWWPRANRCAPDLLRMRVQDASPEAGAEATIRLRRRRLLHHNTIRVLLDQIEGDAEAAYPLYKMVLGRGRAASGPGAPPEGRACPCRAVGARSSRAANRISAFESLPPDAATRRSRRDRSSRSRARTPNRALQQAPLERLEGRVRGRSRCDRTRRWHCDASCFRDHAYCCKPTHCRGWNVRLRTATCICQPRAPRGQKRCVCSLASAVQFRAEGSMSQISMPVVAALKCDDEMPLHQSLRLLGLQQESRLFRVSVSVQTLALSKRSAKLAACCIPSRVDHRASTSYSNQLSSANTFLHCQA